MNYTKYKNYMKDEFWPWWWSIPCDQCLGCLAMKSVDDPFGKCTAEEDWLAKKPQYNQPLDLDGKKPRQVSLNR